MGGKRRRSSGGNIRKKKKAAPKQTLERVAQRKAESEDKLQRRIEAGEALSRDRERSTHVQFKNPTEKFVVPVSIPKEEEEEEKSVIRSKRRAAAYSNLVAELKTSLFESDEVEKQSVPMPSEIPSREEKVLPKKLEKPQANQAISVEHQASIEYENAGAAVREKKHFSTVTSLSDLPSKMTTVASIDNVGRVTANVRPGQFSVLKGMFNSKFASVSLRSLGLQPSVYAKWLKKRMQAGNGDAVSSVAQACLIPIREYHDLMLCRNLHPKEEDEIRQIYVAHVLSHVVRSRARVIRNDAAVKKNVDNIEAFRDQGFSRPRALILLPMKNTAYEVVKTLIALAVGAEEGQEDVAHVANSERFEAEFAPDPNDRHDSMNIADEDDIQTAKKPNQKPPDYRHVFRGNIDDDFKLGITITKKTLRLYSDFYDSDIIIASPLGLRRNLAEKASGDGSRGRNAKAEDAEDEEWKSGIVSAPKKPRADDSDNGYLSSIEVCIVDSAHVFSMQNFDSLRKSIGMMNKMPSSPRDTDFSRLREWCLDGLMPNYRQTVLISNYRTSELVSLCRGFSNHAGRVHVQGAIRSNGTMIDTIPNMRQTFFKVPDVGSPSESPEKRLKFFFSKTLPMLRSLVDSQSLIFVPSYFDYVRVRNKMLEICEEDASIQFASMCEYSKGSDISRARARLYDRSVSLVLMTERFHFYWRHWIRGANTIVWYGLPENAIFYPELLNMTAEAAETGRPIQTVALYDEYDSFQLERIVGRSRCRTMTAQDSRSTYLFM